MARRQLGGAEGSKLGRLAGSPAGAPAAERPALRREAAGSRRNHTVRLSGTEEGRLLRLIARVSEEASRPVSEADLIRGLLVLGERASARALLGAVRHARFDAD